MAREPRSDIARKYAKLEATNSTWGRVVVVYVTSEADAGAGREGSGPGP